MEDVKVLNRGWAAIILMASIVGTANAACPTNGAVTVPFPTGTADVVIYSSPTCVPLVGTDIKVQLNSVAGVTLNATTIPSVTADAAGLHFSANGAPFGAAYTLLITHIPSSKAVMMTANIGSGTQAITASTPTP